MMNDLSIMRGVLMVVAFVVNIIVQLTKGFIPLPTKLWCILVSVAITLAALLVMSANKYIRLEFTSVVLSVAGSFVVAYVAMYGFDTLKDLWQRFKRGEDINDE